MNLQVQGTQQFPNSVNSKRPTVKHIIRLLNHRGNLESSERIKTYKRSSMVLSIYLSSESMEARRQMTHLKY